MTSESTIRVDGMTCGGCEESIQRAVGELEGVSSVEADSRRGTVAVRFDPGATDQEAITALIGEAGYTVAS